MMNFNLMDNILELSSFDAESAIHVYSKTDQIVEKCSEYGYFLMAKVTPTVWVWPRVAINYFIYFTTDSGNDSFTLPVLAA